MSTKDQLAVAALHGQAMRCAEQEFPPDEAVASLREITTNPDLLAEAAGIIAGAADPRTGMRPWAITAARLLVQAGADRELLPRFLAQGRDNATRGGWHNVTRPDDLDEVLAEVLGEQPPVDETRAEFERLAEAQGSTAEAALNEAMREWVERRRGKPGA